MLTHIVMIIIIITIIIFDRHRAEQEVGVCTSLIKIFLLDFCEPIYL